MELRSYQEEVLQKARKAISLGQRRFIIHAPTGAGKTIIGASIADGTVTKGNNLLFLTNRRDLVYQCRDRFESFGIGDKIGIIMSGEDHDLDKPIQIGTIQTYHRRMKKADLRWNSWFHKAQVIIVDEAHGSVCSTYMDVLNEYKDDAVIIGLTATPCRSDGRGLGAIYDTIVSSSGIKDLTDSGYLVPMVYYAPDKPDLKKLHIVAGDYKKDELGEVMDKPRLVGSVYEQWARLASDRQTIIFAVNVKHSKHIRDKFLAHGVSIEHVDAHTNTDDRERIYRDFNNGDIRVLTNVCICTEGSDFPICSCISIARPTKSYGLFIQMAGRGSRPYQGKNDCIIIDHSGCVDEHGFVDDPVEWTLDDKEKAWKKPKKAEKREVILVCDRCCCAFTGKVCPLCGWVVQDYGKKIAHIEAELRLASKEKEKFTVADKRRWYQMFLYHARMCGFSDGWAWHKILEKFGEGVRGTRGLAPIPPDEACDRYIKHLNIKWAKSRSKREAMAA